MRSLKLLSLIVLGIAFAASAAPTANDAAAAKNLPGTLVMRVSEDGKVVSVAHIKEAIDEGKASTVVANAKFVQVAAGEKYSSNKFTGTNELDSDNSRESWWFSFGWGAGYYRPYYGGYGYGYGYPAYYPSYVYANYAYPYYPYYNSYYAGYSYYYYRPLWYW
jgi:hypothetical protein